ncbi:MAG: HAD hydrolase-like protein, partial [Opitutales bacterium]
INRKPSPRFILEMVERHGLSPRHCYMVGDSERDVLAGINAGVIPVALATREEDPPRNWPALLHHNVAVFPDLLSFVQSLHSL